MSDRRNAATESTEDILMDAFCTVASIRELAAHCREVTQEMPIARNGGHETYQLRCKRDALQGGADGIAALTDRAMRELDELENRIPKVG